jgi:hypothetical protein
MSFSIRAKIMIGRGYKFALAHISEDGINEFLPSFANRGAFLIPIWIRSQDSKNVVAILGSEPTDDHKEITIPREYILSLSMMPSM